MRDPVAALSRFATNAGRVLERLRASAERMEPLTRDAARLSTMEESTRALVARLGQLRLPWETEDRATEQALGAPTDVRAAELDDRGQASGARLERSREPIVGTAGAPGAAWRDDGRAARPPLRARGEGAHPVADDRSGRGGGGEPASSAAARFNEFAASLGNRRPAVARARSRAADGATLAAVLARGLAGGARQGSADAAPSRERGPRAEGRGASVLGRVTARTASRPPAWSDQDGARRHLNQLGERAGASQAVHRPVLGLASALSTESVARLAERLDAAVAPGGLDAGAKPRVGADRVLSKVGDQLERALARREAGTASRGAAPSRRTVPSSPVPSRNPPAPRSAGVTAGPSEIAGNTRPDGTLPAGGFRRLAALAAGARIGSTPAPFAPPQSGPTASADSSEPASPLSTVGDEDLARRLGRLLQWEARRQGLPLDTDLTSGSG